MNVFYYNGNMYGKNTVVEIHEEYRKDFRFISRLTFVSYNDIEQLYYFCSPYQKLEIYKLTQKEINKYIKNIIIPYMAEDNVNKKIELKYVEGITSAWIWYIFVMVFGVFLKGAENTIMLWMLATLIFLNWRHRKMKGE